jgi:hypothetical protein
MVDYWNLSDGDDIHNTSGDFDAGGGNFGPIPDGTLLLAIIEDAKLDRDRNSNEYVSIRWSALAPVEFKNRKVFQKIWCIDDKPNQKDPEKAKDKAKRMLFAIDKNAGGSLVASNKAPNDSNLAKALVNKQMNIKVNIWEMKGDDGKMMSGNWISSVSPKGGAAKKAAPQQQDVDDDIPF